MALLLFASGWSYAVAAKANVPLVRWQKQFKVFFVVAVFKFFFEAFACLLEAVSCPVVVLETVD